MTDVHILEKGGMCGVAMCTYRPWTPRTMFKYRHMEFLRRLCVLPPLPDSTGILFVVRCFAPREASSALSTLFSPIVSDHPRHTPTSKERNRGNVLCEFPGAERGLGSSGSVAGLEVCQCYIRVCQCYIRALLNSAETWARTGYAGTP